MNENSRYASFCLFASSHFPRLLSIGEKRLLAREKRAVPKEKSLWTNLPRLHKLISVNQDSTIGVGKEHASDAERLRRELRLAQLPLSSEEVVAGALVAGIVATLVAVSAFLAALALGGLGAAVYLVPLASVAPLAAYSFVLNYPGYHSRVMRTKSLGSTPEAVTYMAMSLKLAPSLNRAVEFAAENTEDPLSERLRGVLWNVYTRRSESIEDSFMSFANDWGESNEDLKRALYGLLGAAGEGTHEALDKSLERAQDTARTGARRRMEEFVSSLKMPTTAFFALCVLLPLVIGTTLPVLSLGGIGISPSQVSAASQNSGAGLQILVILDVVFPAVALAYSMMLLTKRPGTTASPGTQRTTNRGRKRRWVAASCLASVLPLLALLLPLGLLAPIAVLWSVVLGFSVYLTLSTSEQRRKRKEMRSLERQMPDALFILGNKIGEGLSVEQALAKASETLKGLEIAAFLDRLRFSLQLHRRGLEETLFGSGGVLRDYPSRTIRVALKMVVDLSGKDPAAAGKALIDFSHYLRDLQEVEKDIKSKLGEIVEAMRSTATFFAPLVLGITSALYLLLAKSFSALAPLPVSPGSFVLALGVYLVVMVPVIANFSVGLETGGDRAELAGVLGKTWPASLALFTLALLASVAGLGV